MRNPAKSVDKMRDKGLGAMDVREALGNVIADDLDCLEVARAILRGQKTEGFSRETQGRATAAVRDALGLWPVGKEEARKGLQPDIIRGMSRLLSDPDAVIADWLISGAPLGAGVPVTHTGVFPRDSKVREYLAEDLAKAQDIPGWENYKTAEEEPEVCIQLLDAMVEKGWSVVFEDPLEAERYLGVPGLVLNRLGLVTKVKPDGSTKHRLVWDLRRSGVNLVILQGERVVLPRVSDVIDSVKSLGCTNQGVKSVWLLGTDISDAFHQVPLDPKEWQYTAAAFRGRVYVFKVLVFGSVSAPTVWGRYAAWLGRSTAAVLRGDDFRMHVYVDDPIFVASGSFEEAAHTFTIALLWAGVVGFPLAWHKCDGGSAVEWIGATIAVASGRTEVTIPETKVAELKLICSGMLRRTTVSLRDVRKLAGKGSFVAGLVPTINPFLRSLWRVGSNKGEENANDTQPQGGRPQGVRGRALPSHLVFVSQIKRDLAWLHAFMARQRGTLVRTHPWEPRPASHRVRISIDASPWGIGGVLSRGTTPVACFADVISDLDLRRFQASRGNSAFNTVWEALALLVALRLWRGSLDPSECFEVRSDSLGALGATLKGSAGTPKLNMVVSEIMLDEAELSARIEVLEHIPGVSNLWPDALSRLWAPEPKVLPRALTGVPRTPCPARGPDFWITARPPSSARK